MIQRGFTIDNPRTGSRTTLLEGDAELHGSGWLLETRCPAGAPPDVAEHYHRTWTETFEIVSGRAQYRLGGERHTAEAGDVIVMPPGVRQVHPWNAGDTELVYRQRNDFGGVDPDAVRRVLGVFATLTQLDREGKLDRLGRPKNPLQAAVTVREFTKFGGYDASMPAGVQDLVGATLGRVAEALGYRAVRAEFA